MMATSSSRTRYSGHVHDRSVLPAGRPCSSFASSSSSFSASPRSASAFGFHGHHRAASPTRVRFAGTSPPVRLSIADRPTSPGRSLISKKQSIAAPPPASRRRTCMCSPTTHPGSFRCALHKNAAVPRPGGIPTVSPSSRLNGRRSGMANSLVRIGTVEGSDLIRRALSALIRPSSHQQRRRASFHPRPSRLSIMSKAGDELC